jgi:hypothetical protein
VLSYEDRDWVAHGTRRSRSAQLALAGTTGTRATSRAVTVRLIA